MRSAILEKDHNYGHLKAFLWLFSSELAFDGLKKMTLCVTEPHHPSWQCNESHPCCCHGLLATLEIGDPGTFTVLTRYEYMLLSQTSCAADNGRFWSIHRTRQIWVHEITISSPKVEKPLRGTLYITIDDLIRAIWCSYGTSTKMDALTVYHAFQTFVKIDK